jgi:hypothetical protein
VLSEQADEEVDAAEVAVAQSGQPGPHFRIDLDLVQPCHAFNAIYIACYSQAVESPESCPAPAIRPYRGARDESGAGGHVCGEDVVGVAVEVLAGPVVAHGCEMKLRVSGHGGWRIRGGG